MATTGKSARVNSAFLTGCSPLSNDIAVAPRRGRKAGSVKERNGGVHQEERRGRRKDVERWRGDKTVCPSKRIIERRESRRLPWERKPGASPAAPQGPIPLQSRYSLCQWRPLARKAGITATGTHQ